MLLVIVLAESLKLKIAGKENLGAPNFNKPHQN
jgi:hypothetical protein